MLRPLTTIATRPGATGTSATRWQRLVSCRMSPPPLPATRSIYHVARAATASSNSGLSSWITQSHRQQIRTVFIQTENTPNPESLKFVPSGRIVLESEDGTGFFVNKSDPMEEILKSPLATKLFKIEGVKAVYLGFDFVTITKYAENNW